MATAELGSFAGLELSSPGLDPALALDWAYAGAERIALNFIPTSVLLHGVERDGNSTPVLLIPGLGRSTSDWIEMTGFLEKIGSKPQRLEITNTGSVGQTAEKIVDSLKQIKSATGREATLIGHSLGGALATLIAQEESALVGNVITLGTPFGRGRYIHPQVEKHASDIIPNDDSLKKLTSLLDSEEPLPSDIRIHCISAKDDRVAIRGTCHPRAASCTEVYSTHFGLVWNPNAYKAIATAIINAETTTAAA